MFHERKVEMIEKLRRVGVRVRVGVGVGIRVGVGV